MGLLDELDLSAIQDENVRKCVILLLNLVEDLKRESAQLRAENQRLRDEINRLKGEQGKPKIKGNTSNSSSAAPTNYSSERQRHKPKERAKDKKKGTIHIDRVQVLEVDPASLPADAQFKGHEDVVVQDVVFRTDNVLFHKEKFYSPAENSTFLAPLPAGYEGQFGPGIRALTIALYFGANVSEPKALELFRNAGIVISDGQLSNILIKEQEEFHAEKAAVHAAGLASSLWHHLDETGTRVNGQNQHCHVMCNPLYTSYRTSESKDRESVLDALRDGRPRLYLLNTEADGLLQNVLSETTRQQLLKLPREQVLDAKTMLGLLDERLPNLGPQQRKLLLAAAAVASYHAETEFPVIKLLICDDAPQFRWLTEELALCWVHEARHYNKLLPYVPRHQQLLDVFMKQFWDYYDELLAYRAQPVPEKGTMLATKFDALFSTETGYRALDERIAKTKSKKVALLMVLQHPEIALHNNPAELGARQRVRKGDVSFGPRTPDGAKAWDTFMTLAATASKLGVSFYAYIHDRIAKTYQLPGLDALITVRAKELNLSASWC